MTFTIHKSAFLAALEPAARAVPAKPLKPILENVRISEEDGYLLATGSDGSITVKSAADADISDSGGPVTVPGRMLLESIKKMPDEAISVKSQGGRMTISGRRARISLACGDGTLYPDDDAIDGQCAAVSSSALKTALGSVMYASGIEDTRKILNGVFLEIGGGTVRATALDGFQMAHAEFEAPGVPEWRGIIPIASARLLESALDAGDADTILTLGKNQLGANLGGVTVQIVLIEGMYIDYTKITTKFADGRPSGFTARREALLSALERAKLVSRMDGKNTVLLTTDGEKKLTVSAISQNAECVEVLDVVPIGGEMRSAFNLNYLVNAIRSIGGDSVDFRQANPMASAILDDGSKSDWRAVLPVRVRAQ